MARIQAGPPPHFRLFCHPPPCPPPLPPPPPPHSGPPATCSPHAHGAGVAAQDQLATVALRRAQLREELRQVNRKLESQIEARLSKEAAARCPHGLLSPLHPIIPWKQPCPCSFMQTSVPRGHL